MKLRKVVEAALDTSRFAVLATEGAGQPHAGCMKAEEAGLSLCLEFIIFHSGPVPPGSNHLRTIYAEVLTF